MKAKLQNKLLVHVQIVVLALGQSTGGDVHNSGMGFAKCKQVGFETLHGANLI